MKLAATSTLRDVLDVVCQVDHSNYASSLVPIWSWNQRGVDLHLQVFPPTTPAHSHAPPASGQGVAARRACCEHVAVLVTQDRRVGPARGRRADSGGQDGHQGQRQRRGRQRGSLSSAVSAPAIYITARRATWRRVADLENSATLCRSLSPAVMKIFGKTVLHLDTGILHVPESLGSPLFILILRRVAAAPSLLPF
eukprot:SAG31_NODE_3274_length_4475_cov_4.879799_1_plen_196_part_00